MVKNLKRVLAIVLSFTTLFFKGPVCFSMQNSNGIELEGSKGVQLIPTKGKNDVEISYAARKINDADLGRSLDNSDHSKVTVPVMNFFLYPPKSVKELFEVKDKASAFFSGNATMHTDVGHRVEGIDCCCSGCNATTKAAFLGFLALLFLSGIIGAGVLWSQDVDTTKLVWCEGPENGCTIYKSKNGEELYYKWVTEEGSLFGSLLKKGYGQAKIDFAILIGMIVGLLYTIRQLRVTFSKSFIEYSLFSEINF